MWFVVLDDVDMGDGVVVGKYDLVDLAYLQTMVSDEPLNVQAFPSYQQAKSWVDWSRVN